MQRCTTYCFPSSQAVRPALPARRMIVTTHYQSHDNTFIIPRGLRRVLGLLNLANHQIKSPAHVDVEPSTGLGETAVELLCELATFFNLNLSLVFVEIALIADNHERNPVCALHDRDIQSVT